MDDIYNEIRKAMFKNVDELYRNRKKIRKEYQNLEEYAKKEVYKWWFFFYLCHLKNPLKELLWDYLNNRGNEQVLANEYKNFCENFLLNNKLKFSIDFNPDDFESSVILNDFETFLNKIYHFIESI